MAAKEKKGLGIGLDVLFGANNDEEELDSQLLTLPISKVEPRAEQPREYFDQDALRDLADSIAQFGLIQPVVVRRLDIRSLPESAVGGHPGWLGSGKFLFVSLKRTIGARQSWRWWKIFRGRI